MARRRYRPHRSTGEAREKMREVFRYLRMKQGFIARMNFLCCSTCAGCDLGERLDNSPKKTAAAYWHRQNEEYYQESGHLYIHYFAGHSDDNVDESERKTGEAGEKIKEALILHEVVYRWDGSPGHCIEVFDNQEIRNEVEERERQREEERKELASV